MCFMIALSFRDTALAQMERVLRSENWWYDESVDR
jgi:hypothetical protein